MDDDDGQEPRRPLQLTPFPNVVRIDMRPHPFVHAHRGDADALRDWELEQEDGP